MGNGGVIDDLDAYFDAVPRPEADIVDTGAFTLFVGRTPSSYYARPALTRRQTISTLDLDHLAAVCAERGVVLEIEWVHEVHPELADLASGRGLEVAAHALMVLDSKDLAVPPIDGVTVRVLDADDPALISGRAVAEVSFAVGGTEIGPDGPAERDLAVTQLTDHVIAHLRDRDRRGLTITAVAESASGVLAVGSYQPVGDTAEVLAVATLPDARRRGLAAAVTTALVSHARGHGVSTLLLSAQNEDVARVYARVGFHRVGTTHAATVPQ